MKNAGERLLVALSILLPLLVTAVFAPSSQAETYQFVAKWGSSGSGAGEFSSPAGIAVDVSGDLYVADMYNHRIQKFDTNGNFLYQWGSLGSGEDQFRYPGAIAIDTSNNVYIGDIINYRVQKFDVDGTFLTQLGSGTSGSGLDQFNNPYAVAVDLSENLYVADYNNNRIMKFDSEGNYLTHWGATGTGDGEFGNPAGVAVDAAGNVYVADLENHRIQKFDSDGNYLTQWGSFGTGDGRFFYPVRPAVDKFGNVYVADSRNHRIQKFDATGNYLAQWGTYGAGDGQFNQPTGLAFDLLGRILVSDSVNNRIQKFVELSAPLPNGVLSWWRGEDNAQDAINANHGLLMNETTFAAGNVGQAFSFDGEDDYLLANALKLPVGSNPRTLMLWFRTPQNLTASTESALIQYGTAATGNMFGLITSGNAPGKLYFYGHDSDVAGTTTLQPDTWYLGTVTFDGTMVKLYLNGSLENEASLPGLNTIVDGNDLTIGYRPGGAHWQGLLDEIAVFGRALTAAEIAAVYSGGGLDFQPDSFAFSDQTDVNINTPVTSDALTVSGINLPAVVSITSCTGSNCEYRINGGDWTDGDGTVSNGDTVEVRQTSAGSISTTTDLTLAIGTGPDQASDVFSVTTTAVPQYELSVDTAGTGGGVVTSDVGGISCGSACTDTYDAGTTVTLTATPDTTSYFAGWSGGCDANGQVVMDAGTSCIATFNVNAPAVKILLPNGREIVPSGSLYDLNWESPAKAVKFKLKYSLDNGVTWQSAHPESPFVNGTSYQWSVPVPSANKTKSLVLVTGYNSKGVKVGEDRCDAPFKVEVLKLSSPDGGESVEAGSDLTLSWMTNATVAKVATIELYYTLNASAAPAVWKAIRGSDEPLSGDAGKYTWAVPGLSKPKSKCKVMVVLRDGSGRKIGTDASDGYFKIAPTPIK